MDSRVIQFDFRGTRRNGVVHVHDTHVIVWFSDTEILDDFGGQVIFNKDLTVKAARVAKAKDEQDFHNSIIKALKKLDS